MIGLETHDVPQWADGGVREMKPWLFVGAKVAFIGGIERSKNPVRWGTMVAMLDPSQTYTIRDIRVFGELANKIKGEPIGIHLEEVVNPVTDLHDTGRHEPYYPILFFRPVSTIDTTKTVEQLKSLTRDAMQGGKVGV